MQYARNVLVTLHIRSRRIGRGFSDIFGWVYWGNLDRPWSADTVTGTDRMDQCARAGDFIGVLRLCVTGRWVSPAQEVYLSGTGRRVDLRDPLAL